MTADDAVRIPLRAQDGSVRGHTVVDAADAAFVNQWRWHLGSGGYAGRSEYIGGGHRGRVRTYRLHRELLGLIRGDGKDVDHIDRDRLNNRRANLREVPPKGNQQNKPSYQGATSSHRGVCWNKRLAKWSAQFKLNGVMRHVGLFDDEHVAAVAAQAARLREMPYAVD